MLHTCDERVNVLFFIHTTVQVGAEPILGLHRAAVLHIVYPSMVAVACRSRSVRSILVVDDDETFLSACVVGYRPRDVFTTSSVAEGFEIVRKQMPDIGFVDLWLGPQPGYRGDSRSARSDAFGIDVVADLKAINPHMRIFLVSRSVCRTWDRATRDAGGTAAFHKGHGLARIMENIEAERFEDVGSWDPVSLAMNEHDFIAQTYLARRRNAAETARQLEIERATLYRKLRATAPRRRTDYD